jgi:hypothetical protein
MLMHLLLQTQLHIYHIAKRREREALTLVKHSPYWEKNVRLTLYENSLIFRDITMCSPLKIYRSFPRFAYGFQHSVMYNII